MFFSVIIPLFNKVDYVSKMLSSVFSQTYQDYEVIIVDDGSTDGSADIVEKMITCHNGYKLISQVNSGVSTARNHGVTESIGDYLCFLDADDWWAPSFLEEMAKLIEQFPDAGMYASNYFYYKPGKTHIAVDHPTGYMNYPKTYINTGTMPVTSISVCIPRYVFDKTGGFPIGIKLGEDFLLWSKIASDNKVAFLNKPLAFYNNEIPAFQRATRHLYAPEHHMIYNMLWLENRVSSMPDKDDWVTMMDMLRVNGLMDYWLSKKYHQMAKKELEKVDWKKQPMSVIIRYRTPICILNIKKNLLILGSMIKRQILYK